MQFYILFILSLQNLVCIYTQGPSQFRLATFHVLDGWWLFVLDSTGLSPRPMFFPFNLLSIFIRVIHIHGL